MYMLFVWSHIHVQFLANFHMFVPNLLWWQVVEFLGGLTIHHQKVNVHYLEVSHWVEFVMQPMWAHP